MAFIPESDMRLRGRRDCGVEGSKAAQEIRESLRMTALQHREPRPVPQYLTRPDRHFNYVNADIFEHNRTWLNRIAEKPTHDFPHGGKHVTAERKRMAPSPIITPEVITHFSGSVKRMHAHNVSAEKLRALWSDGREAAKRDYADRASTLPSPIPYQNPLKVLPPIKTGAKPVPGRSRSSLDVVPRNAEPKIMGFAGMGSACAPDPERNPKDRRSWRTNAVPGTELAFYGERKQSLVPKGQLAGAPAWADS